MSSEAFPLRSPNHFCTALLMLGRSPATAARIYGLGLAAAEQDGVKAVRELLDESRRRVRLLRVNNGLVVRHIAECHPAFRVGFLE